MSFDIAKWLRQPSTITGIGALVGTAAGAVAQVLTHQSSLAAGAGAVAFAVTHLLVNDNSAAPRAMEKLMTDAVSAAAQNKIEAALPGIVSDGLGVLAALAKPAAKVAGMLVLVGVLGFGLSACSQPKVQAAMATPAGQLFCAFQLQGGGQMVAGLVDAGATAAAPNLSPVAVIATGAAKAQLDADCNAAAANVAGATGGVPVSPPAAAASAPQVAVTPPAAPAAPAAGSAAKAS